MSSRAHRLVKHAGSQLLARLLAPVVDQALPPALGDTPGEMSPSGDTPAKSPNGDTKPSHVDDQGVVQVVKHHQLSPQQLDHVLARIHYDRKYKDLAEEISELRQKQMAARPYKVG